MRLILALTICCGLALSGFAQSDDSRTKQVDALLKKVKQIDILNRILPLLMTKEQIRKVLPAVEKARARVKEAQNKEFESLKKFEARLDAANKKAIESGVLPGRDLVSEIMKMFVEHGIQRQLIASENTEAVVKALKETLNEGQIKAAVNDLNPALFDPSLKPEKMTADDKLRFFVREIFLDPAAYDVLVLLSKTGTPSPP